MDLSTIVVGTAILKHKWQRNSWNYWFPRSKQVKLVDYGDYTGWTIFEDTFVLSLAPTSTPACSTRLGRWSLQYPCLSGIILGTGRALNNFQTLHQKWFQNSTPELVPEAVHPHSSTSPLSLRFQRWFQWWNPVFLHIIHSEIHSLQDMASANGSHLAPAGTRCTPTPPRL